MANYRQIHVQIWKDAWFLELDPDHKLLFIYLFSNERTSVAGIYDLSPRVMAFETGLDQDTIALALVTFEEHGKVYCRDGIVWVKNLRRYNATSSPKVTTRIRYELAAIPDCSLKDAYLAYYGAEGGVDPAQYIGSPSSSIPYQATEIPYREREPDHVLSHAHVPVPVTVPVPREKPPTPPAVVIYGDLTNHVINWDIAAAIHDAVGEDATALDKWKATINAWRMEGYRKENVRGMLDWFRDGIPDRRRNNGKRGNNGKPPTREVEQATGWVDDPAVPGGPDAAGVGDVQSGAGAASGP